MLELNDMFLGFDSKQIIKMSSLLDGLLVWITYLDTCSLGKTPDFENSLKMMVKYIHDCKKILNSGSKIVNLPSELQ